MAEGSGGEGGLTTEEEPETAPSPDPVPQQRRRCCRALALRSWWSGLRFCQQLFH